MKVLVTGGAGFIGSHIVDALIKAHHHVAIIDDLSTGKKEFINPEAIFHQHDLRTPCDHILKEEQPEIVIHCAGQTLLRRSIEHPKEDTDINVKGTLNLLNACTKHPIKKFIFTSTGGARYGNPSELPVKETHPTRPTSPYGLSKVIAEQCIQIWAEENKTNYSILCFGNVYGPRDSSVTKRLIPVFGEKMIQNQVPTIFGSGNQTRDFIYVEDIVACIVQNLEKETEHKIFNLASSTQITVNEVVTILRKETAYEGDIDHKDAIKGEIKDIVLDTTRAKKELAWNSKYTIEEGIKKTVAWMRSEIKGE